MLQAVAGGLIFAVVVLLPFLLLPKGMAWLVAALLLLPLIPVLESLLLTPLYRLNGRFVYYSTTLFVTRSDKGLQLHAGTLYDYLTLLRRHRLGRTMQRKLTQQLLQGLLGLCDDIAQGHIPPDTVVSATSYFFSDRSASRLGFSAADVSVTERFNLMTAALSLAVRLSISKGRVSWPDLNKIRQMQTTAANLLAHRATIERLLPSPAK